MTTGLEGDPGEIGVLAARLRAKAKSVASAVVTLTATNTEAETNWSGAASDAVQAEIAGISAEALLVHAWLSGDAGSYGTYGSELRRLQDAAAALEAQIAEYAESAEHWRTEADDLERELRIMQSGGLSEPILESTRTRLETARYTLGQLSQSQGMLAYRIQSLVEERVALDAWLSTAINDSAAAVVGPLPSLNLIFTGDVVELTDAQLLALMMSMSPSQLAQWAEKNPALVERLLAGADPATVSLWWSTKHPGGEPGTLSPEQLALIAAAPTLFGNLNGITYTGRDAANRAALQEWLRLHPNDPAAVAVRDALGRSADPPMQLITFLPAEPPMAAIAIGNLDTASHVSYAIPGMGTTVEGSAESWTGGAWNIWQEMNDQLGGTGGSPAVVAWMNYLAPPVPGSENGNFEVLSSDYAMAGADRLAADLEGFTAVRRSDPAFLGVIAHSYGSTTAYPALTRVPVDAFVMIGSAGIGAAATENPLLAGETYATMGDESTPWATIGQVSSGRTDPRYLPDVQSFYTSGDTYGPGGGILEGVNVHETEWVADHPGQYGYLDKGTSSLYYGSQVLAGNSGVIPEQPDIVGGQRGAGRWSVTVE